MEEIRVGDRVRSLYNKSVGVVTWANDSLEYQLKVRWGTTGYNTNEKIEDVVLIPYKREQEKQMKKSDLQQGWIVQTEENEFYAICGNSIVSAKGWMPLEDYTDDLRILTDKSFSIKAVYSNDIRSNREGFDFRNKSTQHLRKIWERSEKSQAQLDYEKLMEQIKDLQEKAEELKNKLFA